jgi:hypothetical protein
MRYKELFEHSFKNERVDAPYKLLYHITDYQGVVLTVFNNSLNALRQSRISTTYDPTMFIVGGRSHYHFRFTLDGVKVFNNFDCFYYKSYAYYPDGSKHWYDEKEIGIETKHLTPFNEYCKNFDILIPVFSRSFIQWLFYKVDNFNHRGIDAIHIIDSDWQIPITCQQRSLTIDERNFINDCCNIKNKNFHSALRFLVSKYDNIADHLDKVMSIKTLDAERFIPQQLKKINSILAEKPLNEINVDDLITTVKETLYGLTDRPQADIIFNIIKNNGLFSPYNSPIEWSNLFNDVSNNESLEYTIDRMNTEKKKLHDLSNDPEYMFNSYIRHSKAWDRY